MPAMIVSASSMVKGSIAGRSFCVMRDAEALQADANGDAAMFPINDVLQGDCSACCENCRIHTSA